MTSPTVADRYSRASIAMHWLMVAVFVSVYGAINLSELLDKGTAARQLARDWHSMLGLTVFALVWLRLALRFLPDLALLKATLAEDLGAPVP